MAYLWFMLFVMAACLCVWQQCRIWAEREAKEHWQRSYVEADLSWLAALSALDTFSTRVEDMERRVGTKAEATWRN